MKEFKYDDLHKLLMAARTVSLPTRSLISLNFKDYSILISNEEIWSDEFSMYIHEHQVSIMLPLDNTRIQIGEYEPDCGYDEDSQLYHDTFEELRYCAEEKVKNFIEQVNFEIDNILKKNS